MNIIVKNEKELIEKYKGFDVQKRINSFIKYISTKDLNQQTIKYWIEEIKDYAIIINLDYQEKEVEEQKLEEQENQEEFTYIDDNGKEKISISAVANYLLKRYNFKTIYGTKTETIYFYDQGIYTPKGRELIETKVEDLLQSKANSNIVNEITKKIKRKTAISYENFNEIPTELICLKNGILNLQTKELLPFNKEYYFLTKIPINFNPLSKMDLTKTFIENTFYPEDIPVIQEFFGFCLYKRYFIKKAIILFGDKNTGKTVLMNLLTIFLGKSNTAGLSLQRISSQDKFALSSLKGKYANIYDDLSAMDLKDSGGFKIATGGGFITAEYKFGDSFQFLNFAKNIFSTNKIPNVKDINDDAYYERWIPICCDNQISKEEQDHFLFEKLSTNEELSGLLNWSLDGLDRLLKNGRFSFNKESQDIKMIMQRQNNPLVAFVEEVLEQENGNKITKETMYRVYTKWCNDKKVPRLSKEQLGRSLSKYTSYMLAKGGIERVWENVKIKGDYNSVI